MKLCYTFILFFRRKSARLPICLQLSGMQGDKFYQWICNAFSNLNSFFSQDAFPISRPLYFLVNIFRRHQYCIKGRISSNHHLTQLGVELRPFRRLKTCKWSWIELVHLMSILYRAYWKPTWNSTSWADELIHYRQQDSFMGQKRFSFINKIAMFLLNKLCLKKKHSWKEKQKYKTIEIQFKKWGSVTSVEI